MKNLNFIRWQSGAELFIVKYRSYDLANEKLLVSGHDTAEFSLDKAKARMELNMIEAKEKMSDIISPLFESSIIKFSPPIEERVKFRDLDDLMTSYQFDGYIHRYIKDNRECETVRCKPCSDCGSVSFEVFCTDRMRPRCKKCGKITKVK